MKQVFTKQNKLRSSIECLTVSNVLQNNNIDSDPRQHIIDSICAHVTIGIEKNRMVIIGGDFNENIFSHNLSQSLESIGLINL